MNDGNPIVIYSEQPSEAWNKFVRSYKSGTSCKARQISIQLNIRDVFVRILNKTHPLIALKRRMLKCSQCLALENTVRGCKSSRLNVLT